MRATLFSADFIPSENDYKLLEINTDTGFSPGIIDNLEFDALFKKIQNSNITDIHILYKYFQLDWVDLFIQKCNEFDKSIVVKKTMEEIDSIYTSHIEDADNLLILRLCYDTTSIFDSEYAANNLNLYNIFIDNNDSNSIVDFYYSDENINLDFLNVDTIKDSDILPDFVAKELLTDINNPIEFYKIGKVNLNKEDRLKLAKAEIGKKKLIQKYQTNINENNKTTSIRSINILFSDFTIISMGSFEVESILELPETLKFNDDNILSKLENKHYYEFTTNFIRFQKTGLHSGESIIKSDNTSVKVSEAEVGDMYKSFYLNGVPDTDDTDVISNWKFKGNELPSGSYITESKLVSKIPYENEYGVFSSITLSDGSNFKISSTLFMLVYDNVDDSIYYEIPYYINKDIHQFFNNNGNLVSIIKNEFEVLEGDTISYLLDMEDSDTFFIDAGGVNVKLLSHNCFEAGTKILTDVGFKNIENINSDDFIYSYDFANQKITKSNVKQIHKKIANTIYEITLSDKTLRVTGEHEILTKNRRAIPAKHLKRGDICVNSSNIDSLVVGVKKIRGKFDTYNLVNVIPAHTYFANDILVHNKVCFLEGTQVRMSDGIDVNIEDVKIGDLVLSFNETDNIIEEKPVINKYNPIHNNMIQIETKSGNKIISTDDHPYYVDNYLASFNPTDSNKKYNFNIPVRQLKVGDSLYDINMNKDIVTSISEIDKKEYQTHIITVEDNNNFFANGILVHNK